MSPKPKLDALIRDYEEKISAIETANERATLENVESLQNTSSEQEREQLILAFERKVKENEVLIENLNEQIKKANNMEAHLNSRLKEIANKDTKKKEGKNRRTGFWHC